MVLPTNIADAAAALRDGELGKIETVKIGDVIVSALRDVQFIDDSIVTRKPVQAGYTMTDAAVDLPDEVNLVILLANPDFSLEAGIDAALTGNVDQFTSTWRESKAELYGYKADKEIIEAQTHEDLFTSMMIQSISPLYDVDENYDAWFANVLLVEIQQGSDGETFGIIDSPIEDVGGL
jgi:hypothetical protein